MGKARQSAGQTAGGGEGFPSSIADKSDIVPLPAHSTADGRPKSGWLEERKTSKPLMDLKGGRASARTIRTRRQVRVPGHNRYARRFTGAR